MKEKLAGILADIQESLNGMQSEQALQELKVKYLGKKGEITAMMKQMGSLSPEERPAFGQLVNQARKQAEEAIEAKRQQLEQAAKQARLEKERIDVTMPSSKVSMGGIHPLNKVYREVRSIFLSMGFSVVEGPEIEFDKYNFEMLNIPKDHPARDMQDTFYVTGDIVLRTHTSPVQVRTMLNNKPPIRMICPGRVYRTDDVDATHSPVFNQIEGLVIDKGITFADLKGTINTFLRRLYGEQTKTKFRPGFFPFTEPSAEVDATCTLCGGVGCPACKGAGLTEVLGCGMVNPVVLENCGLDPEEYSGFAFGLGLDRLTNIKYGITDIRLLYENDVRFIEQFK
ncbi:MAG: phenylalanine--tRNA ligase subunit alpha [Christensenellaceae bacterium]|nr:phenylalanine--tRNA ligase subunit alpha [Christensenellaceae bacterium]